MTELEYEKSCRGNQNPTANEFAWGNTSATALSGLSNASTMSETASNTSSNIAYANAFTSGPVRTGIFATGSTARATSGAGYYGNMELSGNLWERVVTLGNATGRAFSGANGNGTLTSSGAADVSGWPSAAGTGWKGGSWLNTTTNSATTSDRAQAANTDNTRSADAGGRGVKTISSGIVTDGLVLWLDAGNKPSYPGSGTAWSDLSGNKNNGTLTNGPTYNSSNGGSIVFDGIDDYVLGANYSALTFGTSSFSISFWMYPTDWGNNKSMGVIDKKTSDAFNGWTIYNDGTNQTKINARLGLENYFFSTTSVINNTWQYWTFVRDGSTTYWYYNNTLDATGSNNVNLTDPQPIWIARSATWNGYFKGNLPIIQIYNRAISSTEILQNFNAQKARFGL
jgi:hypothetical protein